MKTLLTYVGRFQPFHNGHLANVKQLITRAINNNDHVLIVIGSAFYNSFERTTRNPFTYEERKEMILNSIPFADLHKITIEPLEDNPSDHVWMYNLLEIMRNHSFSPERYMMVNSPKEHHEWMENFTWGYQLNNHPWSDLHATTIRDKFFTYVKDYSWSDFEVEPVLLIDWTTIVQNVPESSLQVMKSLTTMANGKFYFKLADEWRKSKNET